MVDRTRSLFATRTEAPLPPYRRLGCFVLFALSASLPFACDYGTEEAKHQELHKPRAMKITEPEKPNLID